MKSLRRSLNGDNQKSSVRANISIPLPPISKPPSAILPPQKVIRALSNYRPQAPQELSFQKGDFFHVLQDIDDQGAWYEAHNPVTGARGLVPRTMFEEFNRNAIASATSPVDSVLPPKSPALSSHPRKAPVFYAVVMHDFDAERADELDAKAGDSITIVAHSNREWFVAKPIGRIGRPGLIPVSFVDLKDPSTGASINDVNRLIERGDIPKVEDWKQAMISYKQNSIPLGVLDSPSKDTFHPEANPQPSSSSRAIGQSSSSNKQAHGSEPVVIETLEPLPEGLLLTADVVSFHYEMEEYWFRIDAIYQPYPENGESKLPPAKQLILFRVYNDFYDFQVSLLETFPREAGRQPPHKRILPYMPGPADVVDHQLTATRRVELDDYVHSLCDLSKAGRRDILEHQIVREFLALKPGDVENTIDPRTQDIERLFSVKRRSGSTQSRGRDEHDREIAASFGRLRVNGDNRRSNESNYEDEGYAPSPQSRTHDNPPYTRGKPSDRRSNEPERHPYGHAVNHHQRMGSTSSLRAHSPYASTSRSNSPLHPERNSPLPQSQHYYHHASTPSTSSLHSQNQSSRGRSQSTSTSNVNSPSISATNPQPAFVKIKIFDRVADDLIAIRVHPRVTHAELMDKVQTRLGGEVAQLRYRDSGSNTFIGIDTDEELRSWMGSTDKHVLFAD